ncbi:Rhodanese-like domain-containing protein 8 chloroplastic [Bienertia sinuspersici]
MCQELDIHGRIYFNEQGINAQFSGPSKDALAYLKWFRDDERFTDILIQISPSDGHAFPRLKLRYKPSLFDLGVQDLPLLDPSMRAVPLSPAEWRTRLKSVVSNHDIEDQYQNSCVLLDVRNGYEWDIGHFQGAQRPEVDCFRSTFGLSNLEVTDSDPLVNLDKDKTDILICCRNCVEKLRGCCCPDCKTAPRLRPVLFGSKRYKKWHFIETVKSEKSYLSIC